MNLYPRQLTGRISFRSNVFGRMVVYVECREPLESPGTFIVRWKPATAGDIAVLGVGVIHTTGGSRDGE